MNNLKPRLGYAKSCLMLGVALIACTGIFFVPAIQQDPAYHMELGLSSIWSRARSGWIPFKPFSEETSAMSSSKLFNALCWVSQTTFPEDLEKGLISVGAPAEVASDIRFAFQTSSSRQIMSFYEEYAYAGNNPEWEKYLSAFLHKRIAEYQPKKEIDSAPHFPM